MRIQSVTIKNFRAFRDETVHLGNYTSLVGPNGAGKSTILCALNIFFRETDGATTNLSDLDTEDFHARDTETPIEITVRFGSLSEEAKKDFEEYFRQDVLIVTAKATFDSQTGTASVRQFGQRSAMEQFKGFFRLYNDGKSAAELKAEYERLRAEIPELPKSGSKDANRDALRAYEEARPEQCTLIPSEDQFYGFSRGSNRLSRYIQWVYVPAVKDATKENVESKNTALGRILARTVRAKVKFDEQISILRNETLMQYQALLETQQGALNEISAALSARLSQWAHPEATARLVWTSDPRKSVQVEEPSARLIAGEGAFEGELARFGHGLQRSYLLALLQELASADDADAPRLILGCEEPELYQHPPQARHLAGVLCELGEGNAQIVVSTHSPFFVSGAHFESVRMVRRDMAAKASRVSMVAFDDITKRVAEVTGDHITPVPAQQAKLHQALQPHINEMFFAPKAILAEGLEDSAYITAWMILSGRWDRFRKHGCHIVPVNGKGYLVDPIIIAQSLAIPIFVLFDADGNKTNVNERSKHEKDNKAILTLVGGDPAVPFPEETVWGNAFVQWHTNLGDALKAEVDKVIWDKAFGVATKGLGSPDGSYTKNPIHIGDHVKLLHAQKTILPSLERLCEAIIDFAANS